MIENYDGYLFNDKLNDDNKVFNATLVMYFLSYYNDTKLYPDSFVDTNFISSYEKIENILTIKNNGFYKDIITDILDDNEVNGNIITNFDLASEFTKNHVISLLYYFGYLSIDKLGFSGTNFRIPNKVITDLYSQYFKSILKKEIALNDEKLLDSIKEAVFEGKINKISDYISEILVHAENRIFKRFDEKYIQMMYFALLLNNPNFDIYNEYFSSGGYSDLYIKRKTELCRYDILIELKYIKKEEYTEELLNEKYNEALNQINKYINDKRISTDNLKKYIVIYVKDEIKLLKGI